jgi:hypothetical protein
MSIELSKIPQSIEQSDKNAALAFTERLDAVKTQELSKLFAQAFHLRYPHKI